MAMAKAKAIATVQREPWRETTMGVAMVMSMVKPSSPPSPHRISASRSSWLSWGERNGRRFPV
eukprot:11568657-Alexandrium_andersonii.AAC.1